MSETTPRELDAQRLKSMLHRIKSLLAKAEATEFEPEREDLNAKAAELIARFGIDAALLEGRSPGSDNVGGRKIRIHAPYVADKQYLLQCIANALRVEVVFTPARRPEPFGHLFGYSADLDRAEMLYTSLLLQAAHGLARARPPYGQDTKAFRRTWLMGFADAVGERLTKAETAAMDEAGLESGAAAEQLAGVVLDRTARAKQAKNAQYPVTQRSVRRLSGTGREGGYGVGLTANLATGSNGLSDRTIRPALEQ